MQIVADRMRPDPELLALVQGIAELVRPDNVELAQWYGNYARQHAARIAHDVALVERYSTAQERVVDVAAVPLLLIGCLAARGRNVEGVDISPARFSQAIATLGVKVVACDIEREPLPFEDSSIDLLVFNEIFEHLRIDPIYTFSEIRRVLKAGAKLVMSTPNALSLYHLREMLLRRRLGPPMYREYAKLKTIGHMGHVREYTVNEVVEFLVDTGFSPDEVVYRDVPNSRPARLFVGLFPAVRPSFSVLASKR